MKQIKIHKVTDNKGVISNQQRCQNPLPVRRRYVASSLKATKVGVNSGMPSIMFKSTRCQLINKGVKMLYMQGANQLVHEHIISWRE